MIDLHTHSFFSDGELIPSELVYNAKVKGYTVICISDHVDFSNLDFVIPRIIKVSAGLSKHFNITVIPGAEITYVPPKLIDKAIVMARGLGAEIVVVHGETTAETVPPGTNMAGILAGADILAHPGRINESEVKFAKEKNVLLEITAKKGHRDTNPHVAKLAKKIGAKMVFNTDSHSSAQLADNNIIRTVIDEAGLAWEDFLVMQENAIKLINKK